MNEEKKMGLEGPSQILLKVGLGEPCQLSNEEKEFKRCEVSSAES